MEKHEYHRLLLHEVADVLYRINIIEAARFDFGSPIIADLIETLEYEIAKLSAFHKAGGDVVVLPLQAVCFVIRCIVRSVAKEKLIQTIVRNAEKEFAPKSAINIAKAIFQNAATQIPARACSGVKAVFACGQQWTVTVWSAFPADIGECIGKRVRAVGRASTSACSRANPLNRAKGGATSEGFFVALFIGAVKPQLLYQTD